MCFTGVVIFGFIWDNNDDFPKSTWVVFVLFSNFRAKFNWISLWTHSFWKFTSLRVNLFTLFFCQRVSHQPDEHCYRFYILTVLKCSILILKVSLNDSLMIENCYHYSIEIITFKRSFCISCWFWNNISHFLKLGFHISH